MRKATNLLFLLVLRLRGLLLYLFHLLLDFGLVVLETSQDPSKEGRALGPVLLLGTLSLTRSLATIADRIERQLTGLSSPLASSLASSFAGSAAGGAEGSTVRSETSGV